ncbi:MAG: FecR family protein [Telluria sp.]
MKLRILKTATLLALAAFSTLALADDPPARVGRVSLAQGQVSISVPGEAASAALVNWPVTSSNTISTAAGARSEWRVGSTAVRLDGDSALEVVQLDDDKLRLRLHYGSASIRVINPDVAAGFELTTPDARVLLQGPGRVRVDAGREADTTTVNVFDGMAIVEGGGERLTVRTGRSAEMQGNDLQTRQALADAFDEWSAARDRETEAVGATRYVTAEMTGYEDLDRHGSWRDDSEYGALWLPNVASTWVPYRDGRWTWIAPWGWTWVDNAPWGYAPFHYGRWVHLNNRWAWAPGRIDRHPVWAPALVGWVGGAGWNLNFHSRPSVAQGWYPLSPHDHFVPGYRLSDERLRRLNWHGRDGKHDGRRNDGKHHDYRQRGLTVVPQDRFGQRGEVVVGREPRVTPPPAWSTAPTALPPTPRIIREAVTRADEARRADARRDGRRDGDDNDRRGGRWAGRGDNRPAPAPAPAVIAQPAPITTVLPTATSPVPQPAVRQPGIITTQPAGGFQRDGRERDGRANREAFEERQQRFQERHRDEGNRGAGGAMEAAMARARAQAEAQARMQRPVTAVVSPPPRPVPTPEPVRAPAAFSQPAPVPQTMHRGDNGPRHRSDDGPRQRGSVRQMER